MSEREIIQRLKELVKEINDLNPKDGYGYTAFISPEWNKKADALTGE